MKNSQATFGHKSLTLNSHLPGNPPVLDRTLVKNHIGIDRLVIRPQYRDLKEPLHLAQGGTAGRVHKGLLSVQAQGRILVPDATQAASMEDQEKALRLAFDPYECFRDSPTTDGVYPFSWLEPTLDTTNYSTGWMPVTRYVRPVAQPETEWSITDQSYRSWAVGLVAPDPRLYDTTLGSTTGTPASLVNKGSIPGPLRMTITMSGAGGMIVAISRYEPLVNPGFETGDLTGWAVILWDPSNVVYAENSGGWHAVLHHVGSISPEISQRVSARPGVPIAVTLDARNATSGDLSVFVGWHRADDSLISFNFMDGVACGTTSLQGAYVTSEAAPPLTAYAVVGVRNLVVSSYLVVDNFLVASGPFVMDLSSCVSGDVVVVNMETCGPFGAGKAITKNGVNAFSLKTSGPGTWLDVPAGTSSFVCSYAAGIASILWEWGHARP